MKLDESLSIAKRKEINQNFKILTDFSLSQYINLDQLFTCEYDENKNL